MLFGRVGRGALTRGCEQTWLVESRLEGSYSPAPRGMGLASLDFWATIGTDPGPRSCPLLEPSSRHLVSGNPLLLCQPKDWEAAHCPGVSDNHTDCHKSLSLYPLRGITEQSDLLAM